MKYVVSIIIILIILLMPLHITDKRVLVTKPVPSPSVVYQVQNSTLTSMSVPMSLTIPVINVDANIYPVGLDNGSMVVPKEFGVVGWYQYGYKPGEIGNAVIDGHVDSRIYGEAVFYHLKDLHKGDEVIVDNLTFVVIDIETYLKTKAPTEKIFGTNNYKGLNLITCAGTFNHKTNHYDKSLVVFTKLKE